LDSDRQSRVRDWIALVLILVSVPGSVFGGMNLACVGQGLASSCSPQAVLISPLLLLLAGVVAGLITRGWTGLFMVAVGQIAGQVVIVILAYLAGRSVPVDLFSGIVATIWFGAPIVVGYAVGRILALAWSAARHGPTTKP
jgi:lysylphosphatidylglycerol synthetase-like protein (DUF2156 family)